MIVCYCSVLTEKKPFYFEYGLLRLHICKGRIEVSCGMVCRHVVVFAGVHMVLNSGLRSCAIEYVCVCNGQVTHAKHYKMTLMFYSNREDICCQQI